MTFATRLPSIYPAAKRKFHNFQEDPSRILHNKLKGILGEKRLLRIEDTSPVYDIRRWAMNRVGIKAYRAEKANMTLNPVQQRIANDLTRDGIAVAHFSELFPHKDFREFQKVAEGLFEHPRNQAQMSKVESGYRPNNPLGLVMKYFLFRLLGEYPVFDHNDPFVQLALSDEIQSIACAVTGSFVRLSDMDYWCNIPTDGPGLYSQTWHRDSEDKRLVKLFLWVRDVNKDTGPFFYIPGSHHYGRYGNFYPQTRLESQYPPKGAVDERFPESERKMYTGEAGTLLLCDTSGLHRGGAPVAGKRLLFTSLFSTNAGWDYGDRFRIAGLQRDKLKPAARYATGRLIDTPKLIDNGHGIYDIEA